MDKTIDLDMITGMLNIEKETAGRLDIGEVIEAGDALSASMAKIEDEAMPVAVSNMGDTGLCVAVVKKED